MLRIPLRPSWPPTGPIPIVGNRRTFRSSGYASRNFGLQSPVSIKPLAIEISSAPVHRWIRIEVRCRTSSRSIAYSADPMVRLRQLTSPASLSHGLIRAVVLALAVGWVFAVWFEPKTPWLPNNFGPSSPSPIRNPENSTGVIRGSDWPPAHRFLFLPSGKEFSARLTNILFGIAEEARYRIGGRHTRCDTGRTGRSFERTASHRGRLCLATSRFRSTHRATHHCRLSQRRQYRPCHCRVRSFTHRYLVSF